MDCITEVKCDQCETILNSPKEIWRHKHREHVQQVKVLDKDSQKLLYLCSRQNDQFECPFPHCRSASKYTDNFSTHIRKKHNVLVEVSDSDAKFDPSKGKTKRPHDDCVSDAEEDTMLPDTKIQILPAFPDDNDETKNERAMTAVLTHDNAILAASDALSATADEQEQKILLAKCGKWHPVALFAQEKVFHMLAGTESTAAIMTAQPQGEFRLPARFIRDADPGQSSKSNTENLLEHVLQSGSFGERMKQINFTEMTPKLAHLLQEDWLLSPQMRYVTPKLFSSAILVDNDQLLYLANVEVYGRLKTLDYHHEPFWRQSISLPDAMDKMRYEGVKVTVDGTSDQSTKLLIGTRTSNLLVTGSIMVKNKHRIIQLGPSTKGFVPDDPVIMLDRESIKAAQLLFEEKEKCWRLDSHDITAQLRQVRSKFHQMSTYTLCRASSPITNTSSHRPFTIWTLVNNDGNYLNESQSRSVSHLFQTIAMSVISEKRSAKLRRADVEAIHCNEQTSNVSSALDSISELFGDEEQIPIIGNENLDRHLQNLAQLISSSITAANKTVTDRLELLFQ